MIAVFLGLLINTLMLTASDAAPATVSAEATAIFAGGCFWCMEADFEKLAGVLSVESGYTGGREGHPTYEQVSTGRTGHAEAVRIHYDLARVSYQSLLDYYWHHVDPTVENRQFCDSGSQYRTAIFYQGEEQQRLAEASRQALLKPKGPFDRIYTEIAAAGPFYPAEDYHQDYYRKNPLRYRFYRTTCGRDARLREVWGEAVVH